MDFTSIAVGLLAVSMFINLAMAIRDAVSGKPFDVYCVPPDARLAKGIGWLLFVAVAAVTILNLLKVLPQHSWTITVSVWFFFENWISVFYRLRKLLGKSTESG